ncbi:MAG: DUF368 domain-containing protein [Verrucomicrobiota bacterium]
MKTLATCSTKDQTAPKAVALAIRGLIGGFMMGLANLVPGISGGTMLLASGVYPRFIQAIAELTTLKFRPRSLLVLGSVAAAATLAILLFAGVVKDLVMDHRWIMYSLFIGLTFGGLPIVWKMARPTDKNVWIGAVIGFVVMTFVALAQASKMGASGTATSNITLLFWAGLVGAAAMILPGISGGYLLLVLGQYVFILDGIEQFKNALKATDTAAILHIGLTIILPVALGIAIGVVAVSNLLRLLLRKYEKIALGVLLGLLLGAVAGIWPFQQAVKPGIGDTIKGRVMTEATLEKLESKDWPTQYFQPDGKQIAGAMALILAGFACTCLVARIGGNEA